MKTSILSPAVSVERRGIKGRRLLLCILAFGLAASEARAQLLVGPNINISKAAGYQGEEAIAINPTNPLNLFAFANDQSGPNEMFGAVSNDGGLTWAGRKIATGSDGLTAARSDPTAAFDKFGNLFISYLDSTVTKTVVGLSIDGGSTFSTLTSFTATSGVDQPTITVGPSGTAAASSVWLTYTDFTGAGAIVARGAAVIGAGAGNVGAFSAAQTTPTSSGSGFGDIAIGPTGKVAVAYQSPAGNAGPSNILVSVNPNGLGAVGFGAAVTATSTNVGGFRPITPQPNRTIDAETSLAWDRSGGVHNGRLYMVYTDAATTSTNDTNIYLRYSDDNGATWSARTQLNTDATTNSQFFCKAAVDPVTGDLAVVWYDARNDPANTKAELWAVASIDGGQTFFANTRVSLGASNGTKANINNPNEFGDYLGLSIYNGTFYPTWADSSNSTLDNPDGTSSLDLYTAAVIIVPEPATWALLLGGLSLIGVTLRRRRSARA